MSKNARVITDRPSQYIPQRVVAGERVVFSVISGAARMLVRDGDDWHVCESHDLVHSGAETDYRIETLSHEATEATLVITGS